MLPKPQRPGRRHCAAIEPPCTAPNIIIDPQVQFFNDDETSDLSDAPYREQRGSPTGGAARGAPSAVTWSRSPRWRRFPSWDWAHCSKAIPWPSSTSASWARPLLWLGWRFLRSAGQQAGRAAAAPPLVRSGLALWLHSFGVGWEVHLSGTHKLNTGMCQSLV